MSIERKSAVTTRMFTAEELAWFDAARYLPQRLRALDLLDWVNILSHRLAIQRSIDEGDLDHARVCFLSIKDRPLDSLRGRRQRPGRPDPIDTPTVWLLRVGDLKDLAKRCSAEEAEDWQCFDLRDYPSPIRQYRPWAHLQVDLAAPKEVIESDFKSWLGRMKELAGQRPAVCDYTLEMRTWSDHDYLPYFDLTLFGRLHDKRIAPILMMELLGLAGERAEAGDLLKSPKKSLKTFNWQTVAEMLAQIPPNLR